MMINRDYDPKYAKALLAGARSMGITIIGFCLHNHILYSDYRKWIKDHEDFKIAAEWGDMQYAQFWECRYDAVCANLEKPALGQLQYAMKNVPLINWVDKKEEFQEAEDPPHEIRITVLPPRPKEKDEESDAKDI